MPFDFLKRKKSDAPADGSTTDGSTAKPPSAAAPGPTGRGIPFDGLTEEWRIVGEMHIKGRLSDALNRREQIRISNVRWAPVDGTAELAGVDGLRMIGTARRKASILSFVLDGVHPHDIGTIVDREGVAIRTGHHCAQPVMERFGVPATARASLAMYNSREDIDVLVAALRRVREMFGSA